MEESQIPTIVTYSQDDSNYTHEIEETATGELTNSLSDSNSLSSTESKDTPILQGHVFKQCNQSIGSKIGLVSFKKRYFVLYDGVLMYYEHQSSYEKDKQHGLKHGTKILLKDLYLTHTKLRTIHHCFTLHVPHKDNKRNSYVLAMSDRKSRNIWIEMLQQQNPQLEPPVSETDGSLKPTPSYINMIRTLTPESISPRAITPEQIHISNLENYHYSLHHQNGNDHEILEYEHHRRGTWSVSSPHGHMHNHDKQDSIRISAKTHHQSFRASIHH